MDFKKMLAKIYLDIDLYTEEEARQELIEMGVDIERVDRKVGELLNKIEALIKLEKAKEKNKQIKNYIEKNKLDISNTEDETIYKKAARNGADFEESSKDKAILKLLKDKELNSDG